MKRLFFVAAVLIFLPACLLATQRTISITDALKLKKVKLKSTRVEGLGPHNIQLELLSLTNDSLLIYFEPGLVFEPQREEFQTLLLADSSGIPVFPREYGVAKLQGYCIESSDLGPRNLAAYNTPALAPADLQELAWLCHRSLAYGQQALFWDYQNRRDAAKVYLRSGKSRYKADFQAFFGKHRPATVVEFTEVAAENLPEPSHVVSIAANFLFMNDEALRLSMVVLNEQDSVVRNVFTNRLYASGAHVVAFGFSDFFEAGSRFRVLLLKESGEIFREMWVDENTLYENKEVYQLNYRYTFLIKRELQNAAINVYHPNGELLSTLKKYPKLSAAYHQLQLSFSHYFDPATRFILELTDGDGKLYEKTEFDALGYSRKLFQEWPTPR